MKDRLSIRLTVLAIVGSPLGCGSSDNLLPLRVDNEWQYTAKTGIPEYVEKVKVTRRVPVAGVQGYELASSMGISRMAWKGDVLYASALGGTRYNPPLPLLSATDEHATFKLKGTMYAGGRAIAYDYTLSQSAEPLTRDGRKTPATKTVGLLRLADREIETQTWYVAGTGIVNQVQRTRQEGKETARFDVELDYLSGP